MNKKSYLVVALLALAGCDPNLVVGAGGLRGQNSAPDGGTGSIVDAGAARCPELECGPRALAILCAAPTGEVAECRRTANGCEWDYRCEQVLPVEEACNGVDDNLNGQIDEGCPTACQARDCELQSNVREEACGIGARPAPRACVAGPQGCHWFIGCESISGCNDPSHPPALEICGNGIDEDCDGVVDNGCASLPVLETCGNGIDDNANGQIDEQGCSCYHSCGPMPGAPALTCADGIHHWTCAPLAPTPYQCAWQQDPCE